MKLIPQTRVFYKFIPTSSFAVTKSYESALVGKAVNHHSIFNTPYRRVSEDETNLNVSMKKYATLKYSLSVNSDPTGSSQLVINEETTEYGTIVHNIPIGTTDTAEILKNKIVNEFNTNGFSSFFAELDSDSGNIILTADIFDNVNIAAPNVFTVVSGAGNFTDVTIVEITDTEIEIPRVDYPLNSVANRVDGYSVRLYAKNATYLDTSKTGAYLYPINRNEALITNRVVTDTTVSTSQYDAEDTGTDWEVSLSLNQTIPVNGILTPGDNFVEIVDNSSNVVAVITDVPINTDHPRYDLDITGKLYVHTVTSGYTVTVDGEIDYTNRMVKLTSLKINNSSSFSVRLNFLNKSYLTPVNFDLAKDDYNKLILGYGNRKATTNSHLDVLTYNSGTGNFEGSIATSIADNEALYLVFNVNGVKYVETFDSATGKFTNTSGFINDSTITFGSPTNVSVTFNVTESSVKNVAVISFEELNLDSLSDAETVDYVNASFSYVMTDLNKNFHYVEDEYYNYIPNDFRASFVPITDISSMQLNFGSTLVVYPKLTLGKDVFINIYSDGTVNFIKNTPTNLMFNVTYKYEILLASNKSTPTSPSSAIYIVSGNNDLTDGDITIYYDSTSYISRYNTLIESKFIKGDLYVDFIELLDTIYDKVLYISGDTDPEEVYQQIGYPDDENPLGIAFMLFKRITPYSSVYLSPYNENVVDGLKKLEAYRDVLHVAIIDKNSINAGRDWVAHENDPEISRFRIVYTSQRLTNIIYTIGTETAYETMSTVSLVIPNDTTTPISLITSDPSIDFTTLASSGDYYKDDQGHEYRIATVSEHVIVFDAFRTTETPGVQAGVNMKLYSVKSGDDLKNYYIGIQSDDNEALVKVLGSGIEYISEAGETIKIDYTLLPVLPVAFKAALPPHQPLTFITYDNSGIREITGVSMFSMDQLDDLVASGYYIIYKGVNDPAPYCLRDVTTAIKSGVFSARVFLSKITPAYYFGKDLWYVTRQYLGRYNVVPELTMMLSLKLSALKQKYMSKYYPGLGTLLKKIEDPEITEIDNGYKISYTIETHDSIGVIDNYITVTK